MSLRGLLRSGEPITTPLAQIFQDARASVQSQTKEKRTLKEFASSVNPRYKWYRHCEVLADVLQAVCDDELSRVMVFEPPRHGKTELVSRIFPAYFIRRHPDRWTGLCSYEATLAQDFSRSARDFYLRSGGSMRDDSSAVNLWQTPERGGMWAAGVGGPITGRGFHLGIIDDPLKNDEEAASETIRRKHKSWYDSTFLTRGEPGHSIVVVQTRWNEDDLSGYLLQQEAVEAEGWHIVNLEAVKTDAPLTFPVTCTVEPDWRKPGEALCPERYDETALSKIKNRVGGYFWSALYQQRPSPLEGGLFQRKWWKYYEKQPPVEDFNFVCQSWDMAFKDTDESDFVVGQVWGVKGPDFYLLDQVRGRMDFPTTVMAVRHMSAKWPTGVAKFVEDAANGAAVIATLRRSITGLVPVKPMGGKESRAAAVSPVIEAGNVYLPVPELCGWIQDFVEECAGFPNAAHDDQVDACTQALAKIGAMGREAPKDALLVGNREDIHPGFDLKRRQRISEPDWTKQFQGDNGKWRTPRVRRNDDE